jgi:hypothetical protein
MSSGKTFDIAGRCDKCSFDVLKGDDIVCHEFNCSYIYHKSCDNFKKVCSEHGVYLSSTYEVSYPGGDCGYKSTNCPKC